jgi:hypothetical protein
MTEHEATAAELIVPCAAVVTVAARDVVVKTDPLSNGRSPDLLSDSFNHSGHFVSQRHRKRAHRCAACSVVGVRVANASGPNADQYVSVTQRGDRDVMHLQWFTGFYQTDGSHEDNWLAG